MTIPDVSTEKPKSRWTRRRVLKAAAKVVGAGTLTAMGSWEYVTRVETEWLAIERVRVPIAGLPPGADGFRIVQMSDFHLYPHTTLPYIARAIALANTLRPDLVALTGDYVLGRADAVFDLAPALTGLNAKHGVYAVLGNHDLWTNRTVVEQGFQEAGVALLKNEGLTVGGRKPLFHLAGLDDGWSGHPNPKAALSKCASSLPAVLLLHEPDLVRKYAHDPRIALQLSGHSHGGQVRVPGRGPLRLPYLGKQYHTGLYRVGSVWVYTTRGIGVVGPPVRFACRPEITELTLVRA